MGFTEADELVQGYFSWALHCLFDEPKFSYRHIASVLEGRGLSIDHKTLKRLHKKTSIIRQDENTVLEIILMAAATELLGELELKTLTEANAIFEKHRQENPFSDLVKYLKESGKLDYVGSEHGWKESTKYRWLHGETEPGGKTLHKHRVAAVKRAIGEAGNIMKKEESKAPKGASLTVRRELMAHAYELIDKALDEAAVSVPLGRRQEIISYAFKEKGLTKKMSEELQQLWRWHWEEVARIVDGLASSDWVRVKKEKGHWVFVEP